MLADCMYEKTTIQIAVMDGQQRQPMYWLKQDANGDISRHAYTKETGHETLHTYAGKVLSGEHHYKPDSGFRRPKVVWTEALDFRTFKGIEPLGALCLAPIVLSQGLGPRSCDLTLTYDLRTFSPTVGRPIPTVTPFLFEMTAHTDQEECLTLKCRDAVGMPCAVYLSKITKPWIAFVTDWELGLPKCTRDGGMRMASLMNRKT